MKEKKFNKIVIAMIALVAVVGSATVVSATTIGTNITTAGTYTGTSASASALTVGLAGATNPALQVDASTALSATGLKIKSAAAAGGLAVSVISSGTNEALTINAKGSGTIGIGSVSTGAVTITPATAVTGLLSANGGITLAGVTVAAAAGPLVLAGTEASPLSSAVASTKFIQVYTKSTATDAASDTRGIYDRLYLSGATTGGGEALRAYTTIDDAVVGTAHGAHLSLDFDSTSNSAQLTGLGVAGRNTLHIPNDASWTSGTLAAVQAEIYSDGSSSDPDGLTELSFIRVVNGGDTTGDDDVNTDAFLFSLQGFPDAGGGTGLLTTYASDPALTKGLRIKVGSTTYYIPLTVTATN